MKILQTKNFFTYVVVGALVIALSISCGDTTQTTSSPTNPEEAKLFKPIELVGTWTNAVNTDTFTVDGDKGTITIGNKYVNIENWDTKKNTEYNAFEFGTSYSYEVENSSNPINDFYSFSFYKTSFLYCIFKNSENGNEITYYKQ